MRPGESGSLARLRRAGRVALAAAPAAFLLATASCEFPFLPASGSGPFYALSIAKYRGDKAAAVSYMFDDGYEEQYTVGMPLLEAHGIHAT